MLTIQARATMLNTVETLDEAACYVQNVFCRLDGCVVAIVNVDTMLNAVLTHIDFEAYLAILE